VIRDLAATSSRVDNGVISIGIIAFPAFSARIVSIEEIILNTMNESFSRNAVPNVLRDRILLKIYQSKRSRTKGRETASTYLIKQK
jgi:hypothetical protein